MSADLSIRYTRPLRFDDFTAEAQRALSQLLRREPVPQLVEFSAPNLPSSWNPPPSLGPETDWLLLGFVGVGALFELGVCPDPPRPEFRVETNASLPLAPAAGTRPGRRGGGTPSGSPAVRGALRLEPLSHQC